MALQKQTITLDFGFGGVDERTDPKYLQRVKFADLSNVRFNKVGRIDRRPGHAASFTSEIGAGTFSSTIAKLLSTGEQIIAITAESSSGPPRPFRCSTDYAANRVTSNGGSITEHMPVSYLRVADLSSSQMITEGGQNMEGWDRADSADHACVVYTPSASVVRIEIFDKTTHSLVRAEAQIAGYAPRVIAHPDGRPQWVFAYALTNPSATTGPTYVFQTVSLTTTAVTVTGMPSITQARHVDWAVAQDATESSSALVCIGWISDAVANANLRNATWPGVDGSGTAKSTTIVNGATGCTTMAICSLHNPSDTTADFRAVWYFGTANGGVRTGTFNRSLTAVLAAVSVASSLSASVPSRLVGAQLASGEAHVAAEYVISGVNKILGYSLNSSNTPSLIWTQTDAQIHSKAKAKSGGYTPYAWISQSTTQQKTLFLIASTPAPQGSGAPPPVVGRALHTTSWGGVGVYSAMPSLQHDGSEFVGISTKLVRVGLNSSSTDSQHVLKELRFSPDGNNGWLVAQNRSEALIGGGYLSTYSPAEGVLPSGPLVFPYISLSATTSGGSLALGSYAVSGFFEHTDATGRVRRSAPALPVTFALTGSQNGLIVTVRNYTIGDALGSTGSALRFVPTRTLVNESQVYYRAGSTTVSQLSATTNISLTIADATASAEEPMYTTGGVYENWQPSAPIAIATNGRRALAVAGDDPNFIMESKPIVSGQGVHFMETVGRSILPYGDRIHALASYRDNWFAFKESAVLVASGDGADVTGQNDTLSEFQPLITGTGCTEPRSVVTTSAGVIFKSARSSFYIIGPDTQPKYIGGAVEDFVGSATVVDSAYDSDNEIVYFNLSNQTTIVVSIFETEQGYDIRVTRDTATSGSVAVLDGRRYCAPTTGIYAESTTSYIDAQTSATAIPTVRYTTAWSSMGGIQGFGRIYKALFTGQFSSTQASTTVTVAIGYDYDVAYSETHTIDSATFKRSGQSVQFELRPARTRCEAIRFDIQDSGPVSVTAGSHAPGLAMSQIQLEVGIKAGSNKLPSSAMARKA